jgi:protein gp37
MRVEWVDEIFEECRKAGVAFFFKQYAGPYQGWKRDYRGRIWEEYPAQAKKTQSC